MVCAEGFDSLPGSREAEVVSEAKQALVCLMIRKYCQPADAEQWIADESSVGSGAAIGDTGSGNNAAEHAVVKGMMPVINILKAVLRLSVDQIRGSYKKAMDEGSIFTNRYSACPDNLQQ